MRRRVSIVICGLRAGDARRLEQRCQLMPVRLRFVESRASLIPNCDAAVMVRGVPHRLWNQAVDQMGRSRVVFRPSRSVDSVFVALMGLVATAA